jgi:TolB-like protein/DNA-binding winged helix-turn-helix (wHTH) protein
MVRLMANERETWLRVGDWCVRPAAATMSRDGKTQRVETRTMGVLLVLASHPGEVVSSDELLATVWPDVTVSQDSVYQAVASLRRLLGDDPKEPAYIATVPRLGYRMVAEVSPWSEPVVAPPAPPILADRGDGAASTAMPPPAAGRRRVAVRAGITALLLLFAASVWFFGRAAVRNAAKSAANAPATVIPAPAAAARAETSIAVLPFIDLTDKMNHEIFVDGMTEELVDKLSKVPGLHVPPARTSLAFKGKHPTIAGVAKTLGTTYVLDGSVRNSGKTLRVEAQLVRADSGFVVWSETYDRPSGDLVKIEDEIAAEVTRSLAAIAAAP